jgi:hypothetical protein
VDALAIGRVMIGIIIVVQMLVEGLLIALRAEPFTLTSAVRPIVVLALAHGLHAGRRWAHVASLAGAGLTAVVCFAWAAQARLGEPFGLGLLGFGLYHATLGAALWSPPVRAFLAAQRAASAP